MNIRFLNNGVRSLSKIALIIMALLFIASCDRAKPSPSPTTAQCTVVGKVNRVVNVNMVALDQSFWYNRLGASQLDGKIYALASDVVLTSDVLKDNPPPITGNSDWKKGNYSKLAGQVSLRPDKRPRPIVLRANVSDCLQITFTNLLAPNTTTVATTDAGVHITGTEVFSTTQKDPAAIQNDAAFIGKNTNNLAASGARKTYSLYVRAEGAFVVYSAADDYSNFLAGQLSYGLFGSLNVQPKGAEYYRSQVTEQQLAAATKKNKPSHAQTGQPLIDYQALDSNGKPILNMLQKVKGERHTYELVYTDPTAIITGPKTGEFSKTEGPSRFPVPEYPDRQQPYREFNIVYHQAVRGQQAFSEFDQNGTSPLINTLDAGGDFFAINYGMAAIGPEIWANRIGVGPMYDCVTCEYEEFFLSSWAVGDPAMVVDVPANFCDSEGAITPSTNIPTFNGNTDAPYCDNGSKVRSGPKATKAFYPDDPSNVYHSYMSDHVKMRIHHGAGTLHHLHHLHAHQWLHSPNDDDGHYLDSQLIGPGSSFTLDMVYNGSGNKNKTVGDSIFHCHFYPHFAEGMWSLWRVHDVFEAGTKLDENGRPASGSRALPDGEIADGTPIPGLVPLPTRPMAPVPSDVHIENGQVVYGTSENPDPSGENVTKNPGYPFFIPGVAGERVPHPPLDVAILNGELLNGGLPRHVVNVKPGIKDSGVVEYHNRFDFSKFYGKLHAKSLPEEGTVVEKVAMATHAIRNHPSFTPEDLPGQFVLNGKPPVQGAPYAEPCMKENGMLVPTAANPRHYRAVDMQMDVILNKEGWHYSQQRFGVLWEDLIPTLNKERPPEPLFFRSNSDDCIVYWLANVVPEYYELDDFQVRTPTDVLGQHIHLVKFDVTSSDGGANGWNYEDGTYSPQAVVERIDALNAGTLDGDSLKLTAVAPNWLCENLAGKDRQQCLAKAKNEWLGAQATVQRWYSDPQLNNLGVDRTLRTVFTHDHFSPSTHQQAGLYMGLLVQPEGSTWKDSETGTPFYTRPDGGPTSFQAIIEVPPNAGDSYKANSYREFALEFQDFALAYQAGSTPLVDYPHENKTTFYGEASESDYAVNIEPKLNRISNPNPLKTNTPCLGTDKSYVPAVASCTNGYTGYLDPDKVINPPQGQQDATAVTPTLVSSTPPFALGTYTVNYRNEPLPLRVTSTPNSSTNTGNQTSGDGGDLARAYTSIKRANPKFNQLVPDSISNQWPLTAGVYPYDPYTPLLRAYQGDYVKIHTLVGAHINMHNFSMQGFRWIFEPANHSSGYRSNQPMGISEHFEMLFDIPPSTVNTVTAKRGGGASTDRCAGTDGTLKFADYFYNPSSSQNGLVNGNWGLFRAYQPGQDNACLEPLPSAPPSATVNKGTEALTADSTLACPKGAPKRVYNVVAVSTDSLSYCTDGKAPVGDKCAVKDSSTKCPDGKAPAGGKCPAETGLVYNFREGVVSKDALVYFGCDATNTKACTPSRPHQTVTQHIEPFVLRAAAGECVTVNLTNKISNTITPCTDGSIPTNGKCADGKAPNNTVSNPGGQNALLQFGQTALAPSQQVGMSPQLVSYDINRDNGVNLGFNQTQTVAPGKTKTYTWYAGIRGIDAAGNVTYNTAEFGSANLLTADPVMQPRYGMLSGMVIEPEGSCWSSQDGGNTTCSKKPSSGTIPGSTSSSTTGSQVTVHNSDGSYFQEFVVMPQDVLTNTLGFTMPVNYGIEQIGPITGGGRYTGTGGTTDVSCGFSNALGNPYGSTPCTTATSTTNNPLGLACGAPLGDPEIPIFQANPGDPTRFRVMQPHGATQHVFELFGHVWQEEPYNKDSTVITNNPHSQWQGSRMGVSAKDRFDIVLPSAGGTFAAPGDYLYRSYPGGDQNYGMWGIFRVGDPKNAYDENSRPGICKPPNYTPTATGGSAEIETDARSRQSTEVAKLDVSE